MSTRLEKLMFTIGLMDNTKPGANRAIANLDRVQKSAQQGFVGMASGAGLLYAAGRGLEATLRPAIEMDKALGEVRSLDVQSNALAALEKQALKFSIQYGESATDFVRSSYDIQSAIAGLEGNELAVFTRSSNVLAKATKSDAATITDYMGTMYGIFEQNASVMGKAKWVEQITGQTALAVQMFKTTGSEMAGAFSRLGSSAQQLQVSTAEQMAIMGMLQSTMTGSEAATKYQAFLTGAANAQKALNIELTDGQGRLLPMNKMLDILTNRVGDLSDIKNQDVLKKAFGRKEAVALIGLLSSKSSQLADNIQRLERVNGMDKANKMAKSMVDPFEQLNQLTTALTTVLGKVMLPILKPIITSLISMGDAVLRFSDEWPFLSKVIGVATLALFGFMAVGGATMFLFGALKTAAAGWLLIMAGAKGVLAAAKIAVWLFNFALYANPIGLIVAGIVLAIAAISGFVYGIYKLVTNWESVKKAFLDHTWIKAIIKTVGWVSDAISKWFGFGDEAEIKVKQTQESVNAAAPDLQSVGSVSAAVPSGGLLSEFSQTNTGTHVEKVEIHSQKVDSDEINYVLASMG